MKHGLFVGLTTLDCIYQAVHPPAANEKIAADNALLVAGGPATNAAVAFAQLGKKNQTTLVSAVGQHPLTTVIREDLESQGLSLNDLAPHRAEPPPIASIVVSKATGDRAVISRNAAGLQADLASFSVEDTLTGIDIVLLDGHQMALSAALATAAQAKDIPVVVDAGSWKPGFETVLAHADVVIASANFWPPDCDRPQQVFDYLRSHQIPRIAITQGAAPILYVNELDPPPSNSPAATAPQPSNIEGINQIDVPQVRAVDTLGAGDIFHGAFCHFYLTHSFEETLLKASRTASFACQHWGTRDWTKIYRITEIPEEDDEGDTDTQARSTLPLADEPTDHAAD